MPSHERTTYYIETSPAGTGLSNNPDLDLKVFHRLAGFAEPFLLRHAFLRLRGFGLFEERGQLVDWDWKYRRRVLLRGHLHKTLKESELQGHGLFPDDLGRIRQLLRGLKLSFGVNDFGPSLPLRLRLLGHGPLHLLRQIDVL